MLQGDAIQLRTVREGDLDALYGYHQDIANRGRYFPTGVMSEPAFRNAYAESGFWEKERGMLVIVDEQNTILGHIEYFPTVPYLDELELSYHIYSPQARGKGAASEAVRLLTGYLFGRLKQNRIRLVIHPENEASKRVAEKCGYQFEGLARGAWFHQGSSHDVAIYGITRGDYHGSD